MAHPGLDGLVLSLLLPLALGACSSRDDSEGNRSSAGAAGSDSGSSGQPAQGEGGAGLAGESSGGNPSGGVSQSGGMSQSGGVSASGGSAGQVLCGGRLGETCSEREYCAYEGGDCGFADGTAECRERPSACDAILAPVCGCDGVTYSSACVAALAGVGYLHDGACDLTSVSCDEREVLCDSVTPVCPEMQVPSVTGGCYGSCVPIHLCTCTSEAECPDSSQYTCWISSGRCGPYVI